MFVTQDIYNECIAEMNKLEVELQEITQGRIETRENCGDGIAHNFAYDQTVLEEAAAEKRLLEMIKFIQSLRIINMPTERPIDKVSLFSKVKISKRINNKTNEIIYEIVPYEKVKNETRLPYSSPLMTGY
jgi:hypothetical protein